MRKVLVTAPTFSPLEVEEIKVRPELRISGSDDDIVLSAYIKAAVNAYEKFSGRILCASTWDLYFDEFSDQFETPAPLSSVTSITYTDTSSVEQTVTSTDYVVDTTNQVEGRIVLAYGSSWPTSVLSQINTVKVRVVVGYASVADIPEEILTGLILKIQELYDGTDRSSAYESCWIADARLSV